MSGTQQKILIQEKNALKESEFGLVSYQHSVDLHELTGIKFYYVTTVLKY